VSGAIIIIYLITENIKTISYNIIVRLISFYVNIQKGVIYCAHQHPDIPKAYFTLNTFDISQV